MHLILHWLANLTQQTKGSKFLRVGWRKVRNHHHYIWETKTNMSIQEWPSHHKFDTNSDQKCWNLKASDLSTGKMLVSRGSGFIKQGFLLACLVHFCWWAFLGWRSPLSLKHQAQWVPDFNWSCEMTPWKQAGSECPYCPSSPEAIQISACDCSRWGMIMVPHWNQLPQELVTHVTLGVWTETAVLEGVF